MKNDEVKNVISRRDFLKTAAGAAVSAGLAGFTSGAVIERAFASARPSKSKVVLVTHKKVLVDGWEADSKVLQMMMDAGLKKLTGKKTAEAAWKEIVKPQDVVAIKYNQLGGPTIRTRQEVIDICIAAAKKSGVAKDKIIPYAKAQDVPECWKGWGEEQKFGNTKGTRLGNILAKGATCLINLPVVKTHSNNGFTCALKNHMGSNDNPREFHPWDAAVGPMWENIGYLNAIPAIKDKTRLIIADATRPLYNGGPGDKPEFRWDYHTLVFGIDPVAVDRVCLDIVDEKRKTSGLPPADLGRKSIEFAGKLGVGNYDLSKIDIIKIVLG